MKKAFTLIMILFWIMPQIFAQNVPNGGFEDWEINDDNVNEPVNWQTNNMTDLTFVYQETGHSGQSAARIAVEYDASLQMNITPVLFYDGYFSVSQRYTALKFYMKGESLNDDYLMVTVGMRYNGINIGSSFTAIYEDYGDWTQVSVPIDYATEDTPDECFISFTFWEANAVDVGTYCFIDDVELGSGAGPIIPVLLAAATNTEGTAFELNFNTPMADPSGMHGQFSGTHDGSSVNFTAASLKNGENTTIILTLNNPVLVNEVLKVSYTAGTVTSAEGVALESFSNREVVNLVGGTTGSWHVIASGVEENLYCVHFANANTGYIGGGIGRIMKSVNSGLNWSTIPPFTYAELFTLWATSPDVVHVGAWDTVYNSSNGGQSWNGVYINTVNFYVMDMQFHTSSLGYAFLQASAFMKTSDGGNSWGNITGSGVIDDFLAGYMIDETNGFAVGGAGLIAHTTDGGQTWPQYDWNNWTEWSPLDIEGVHFTSLTNGFAVADSGVLFRTTNGGEHWTKSYIAGPEDRLKDIYFLNANLGWIVGYNGKIFSTTDGGSSWIPGPSVTTNNLNGVYFISSNLGWAVGDYGTILRFGDASASVNETGYLEESLFEIYPNPVTTEATLSLAMPSEEDVRVEIFDISGRYISCEFNGKLPAGDHLLRLEFPALENGMYFCRISCPSGDVCKPFVISN